MSGPARSASLTMLAGWLFADMLLALVLVALGSDVDEPPAPAPAPSPTLVSAPRPSPTPSPTPTPLPPEGLDPTPREVSVRVTAAGLASGRRQDVEQVHHALQEQLADVAAEGRRAAIVLTFGADGTPGVGQQMAVHANGAARTALPDVFGGATFKDYHMISSRNSGTVRFEIYLFHQ